MIQFIYNYSNEIEILFNILKFSNKNAETLKRAENLYS